ncbi:MAG: LLM class flavin-dependent oxidoreductase [Actinomycetota bacterium]
MSVRVGINAIPVGRADLDFVVEAERLGVDSVWVPEFWGYDAFTPLAALAPMTERIRLATGIVQLGARSPASLAMTAMSLQAMSGGRFILGLGVSGPQVMEGWHGVRFTKPVTRTRETIEIIRMVAAGERLRYDGDVYQLPLPDGDGKAIRSIAAPVEIPIYLASLGPANLRLTGELADGWIGNSFFAATADVFFDQIAAGAATVDRSVADVEMTVAASLEFAIDDEHAAVLARTHADGYAFTFGAMGSSTTNFYNQAFERQGYGDDVREVERLWRAGDRAAAAARVPLEIGRGTNLIGTDQQILDQLRAYAAAGVSTLRITLPDGSADERLAALERLLDLAGQANAAAV